MQLHSMNLSSLKGFNEEYGILPPGVYHVRIVDDAMRVAHNGTQYLNLRYDVVEGPHTHRCLFDGLHFWNPNEAARRLAQQKLKSIALAVRLPNPDVVQDSAELLQREMLVSVRIKTDDYGEKNEIRLYKPLPVLQAGGQSGSAPAAVVPAAAPVPVATQPQTAGGTPWDQPPF